MYRDLVRHPIVGESAAVTQTRSCFCVAIRVVALDTAFLASSGPRADKSRVQRALPCGKEAKFLERVLRGEAPMVQAASQ